jgi:deoxycytidylate deaminase
MVWTPNMKVTTDPIHRNNLSAAYYTALYFSQDPDTQNGAVIVNSLGEIISRGANRFPIGTPMVKATFERPGKYAEIDHAETNAIYKAVMVGNSTYGATLYCPWLACIRCGIGIRESGIKTVVAHEARMLMTSDERWQKEISFALKRIQRAGIETLMYRGKFAVDKHADLEIKIKGETWHP